MIKSGNICTRAQKTLGILDKRVLENYNEIKGLVSANQKQAERIESVDDGILAVEGVR
jgi:hypothetical protein